MALSVIGIGYPRTGTMSMKLALEQLGFGPCHHMVELFNLPQRWQGWIDATRGKAADFEALLEGYTSSTDVPVCYFYRELLALYPDAKFILTERPASDWYDSALATILSQMLMNRVAGTPTEELIKGIFIDRYEGREYERGYMPAKQLLVCRPGDGWRPLCDFLGVPVPDGAYPKVNSREEWVQRQKDKYE